MRGTFALVLALVLGSGCNGDSENPVTDSGIVTDADGDGFSAPEDCDDDPNGCGEDCFPGNPAADDCDGFDNDCDGTTDEDASGALYADCDGDGAFSATPTLACDEATAASPCASGAAPLGGYSASAPALADCDDEDATANLDDEDGDGASTCEGDCDDDPSGCGSDCFPDNTALDTCENADIDCDGINGEDGDVLWFADCDGDGEFRIGVVRSCVEPSVTPCADEEAPDGGWRDSVPTRWDCDDEDATANYQDADGDGLSGCEGDCDDNPAGCGAACSPNLTIDGCDAYDNDCDTQVDEDPDRSWYLDADGDTSTTGTASVQCDAPGATWREGASAEPDCNDADPALNTVDSDGDGESTCAGDCDDDASACGAACNTSVAIDGCGGDDNDCDGQIDEDPGSTLWYLDADGDTWVASATGIGQCTSPGANYTTRLSTEIDCDDSTAALNYDDADSDGVSTCEDDCDDDPASCGADCSPLLAVDGCDSRDNDCDDQLDEDPDIPWYGDEDEDGWVLSLTPTYSCEATGIYTLPAPSSEVDCDDGIASLNHDDADNDGVSTCDATPDCADRDVDLDAAAVAAGLTAADVYPGASETWYDGADQDCTGDNDFDQDGDLQVPPQYAAEATSGYTSGDCDDDPTDDVGLPASMVYAGADELCDGLDNNCNGDVDEGSAATVFVPDAGAFQLTVPGAGTEPATITITEPGVLRLCDDDGLLVTVDSDDVSILGINGRHDIAGGVSWLQGRVGGEIDQVNLLGGNVPGASAPITPLAIEAGAEVTTPTAMDLRGTALVDGSWTANGVTLVPRSAPADPGDPSTTEGDAGQVQVRTDGQLDGSYFTANNLDRTPFIIQGYAYLSWLTAYNNEVAGSGGVARVHGSYPAIYGGVLDLDSVTMVGNKSNEGGAIYSSGDVTISGFTYMYDNESPQGSEVYCYSPSSTLAIDGAEIMGRGTRADGTTGQAALVWSRGQVTLNNVRMQAQLHADTAVQIEGGSLVVNGSSFAESYHAGVVLKARPGDPPTTASLTNVYMWLTPSWDLFVDWNLQCDFPWGAWGHVASLSGETSTWSHWWWGDTGNEQNISATCDTTNGCTSAVAPECP